MESMYIKRRSTAEACSTKQMNGVNHNSWTLLVIFCLLGNIIMVHNEV